MRKLKPTIKVIKKKDLYYTLDSENRLIRYRPWLGDSFSFLYDLIMERTIFPKKFGGDIDRHYEILGQALANIRGKRVLELATGSGSAVRFLDHENRYTGTDISVGLLKQAAKRFKKANFADPEFYVASADDLPFQDGTFDLCLCILSLNFFGSAETVFQEIDRLLVPGGTFVCSVPVPERNKLASTIRGVLHSEAELEHICQAHGFRFEPIPCENGVLLYFKAHKPA